jgi:FOG: Ankyrin repeat
MVSLGISGALYGMEKRQRDDRDDQGQQLIEAVLAGDFDKVKKFSVAARLNDTFKAEFGNSYYSYKGMTALMVAAQDDNTNIVNYLLECDGININAKSRNNQATALIHAAEFGHVGVVKLLLNNNASVDNQTIGGKKTALMFAVKGGYVDIVKLLLRQGASIDLKDKNLKSVLDLNISNNCDQIGKLLEEASAAKTLLLLQGNS